MIEDECEYLTFSPKPYRGVPIGTGGPLPPSIARQFSGKPPSSHYVTFAIWDDSCEEFQVVRDHLIERGYKYRLLVLTEGDEVFYGSVVDPKVQ